MYRVIETFMRQHNVYIMYICNWEMKKSNETNE